MYSSGGVAHVILLHDIILYHMNVFVSLDIATPKSSISSGDGQLPVDVTDTTTYKHFISFP